jgi:hypothetical protein
MSSLVEQSDRAYIELLQKHLALLDELDELDRLSDFYYRVIDVAGTTSLPLIESYILAGILRR